MDDKTKILFGSFLLIIAGVGFACYKKFVIDSSYLIHAEAACDPLVETCFIYSCDPEIDECTDDPDENTPYYYKEVTRSANQLPSCDPNSEECFFARCNEDEVGCSVTLCNPDDSESTCSSIDDFVLEGDVEEVAGEDVREPGVLDESN